MESGSLLADTSSSAEREVVHELLAKEGLKIERIVSFGQASPKGFWYDQETHEWVMVVSGRAGLEFKGSPGVVEMGPGDYVDIPAHEQHRVAWTSPDEPTIWLAVHY